MDPGLATGGGIFGGAVSMAYAVKLLVEARRESRADQAGRPTPVSDAAEANALLLAALQEERGEVQRLSREVDALRRDNSDLYEQMRRQRRDADAELQTMRDQLAELTSRLEQLQTRIRASLPTSD